MLCRFRFILMICLVLFFSFKTAAQHAMPDNVYIGAVKQYTVDPNPAPGSTYVWSINGIIQNAYTGNVIDISWNATGNYLIEVHEINSAGCTGESRSGMVYVTELLADLYVVKTVNNATPIIGQHIEFSIIAGNNGPDNATDVTVTDVIESGYVYVSHVAGKGDYNPSGSVWTIGNLLSGTTVSLMIKARVENFGNYHNTAIITGRERDNFPDNNESTAITLPTDFFIPNGFSPNGDGINDTFVIRGIGNYPDNEFVIFNRWGNKVFEANPYQNTWNGKSMFGLTVGGNDLPVGTYFYVLDLKDGSSVFKGTIYLNR
jgi:gliding motility-associated-like protein/uncharacterized repeat protein (TIGR01451 family)